MGYHQLPAEILEDSEALSNWVSATLAVARQARTLRSQRRGV
jgi:hypothetical protein